MIDYQVTISTRGTGQERSSTATVVPVSLELKDTVVRAYRTDPVQAIQVLEAEHRLNVIDGKIQIIHLV
ncbi:hypothetical protein CR513_14987, partial [Mucuna pruriens]